MEYTLNQHKHNFAVWAAARASQRGLTTVATLKDALECSGIRAFLESPVSLRVNRDEFNSLHRAWCYKILARLSEKPVPRASFGRAAKLVAVYIKAQVVVGGDANCALANVAHPPIDRILLQNISKSDDIDSPHKSKWRSINWTELDEEHYYELIEELSACLREAEPMWTLERYWTITSE